MKKQTQKKNLSKKAKILMSTLIPVGAIGVAAGITIPLVLKKQPQAEKNVYEMINNGSSRYWALGGNSVTLNSNEIYTFIVNLDGTHPIAKLEAETVSPWSLTHDDHSVTYTAPDGSTSDVGFSVESSGKIISISDSTVTSAVEGKIVFKVKINSTGGETTVQACP